MTFESLRKLDFTFLVMRIVKVERKTTCKSSQTIGNVENEFEI